MNWFWKLLVFAAILAIAFLIIAAVDPRLANDIINFLNPQH